ncbi:MAG: cytochrome c family protein, partial [Planctomycetales bacterium]
MSYPTLPRVQVVCFLAAAGLLAVLGSGARVNSAFQKQAPQRTRLDPAKVLGEKACQECHKSEIAAWKKSSHATKSFALLTQNDKAKDIAAKADVAPGDLTTKSLCLDCHAATGSHAAGADAVVGNSCETCHGVAGPKDGGWIAIHNDYGGKDVKREQETEDHYRKRAADCDKLGMRRSAKLYDLAKNCYVCHTVSNEKVIAAGHPAGKPEFEFTHWLGGEVRHNFQQDQAVNAEAPTLWTDPHVGEKKTVAGRKRLSIVMGQLVDLEVSLRNRASAQGRDFAEHARKRILQAKERLEQIDGAVDIPAVKKTLELMGKVRSIRLRRISATDG